MESKPYMRRFLSYYLRCFVQPGRTFSSLLKDGLRVRLAVLAVLIPATGYTIIYLSGWLAGGAPSTFTPWLAIPIEEYFKYDINIAAPSMFLCFEVPIRSLSDSIDAALIEEPAYRSSEPDHSASRVCHPQPGFLFLGDLDSLLRSPAGKFAESVGSNPACGFRSNSQEPFRDPYG